MMNGSAGIAIGLLAGAAMGAALGVLLAPTSGRELRAGFGDRYREASGKARDLADETRRQARQTGKSVAESAHAAIEEGRRKADRLADRAHAGVTAVTPA
jgi:gas vesicle protein